MIYKSQNKIEKDIEYHEGILETSLLSQKECDYQIARAKTTLERLAWQTKRNRWEKRKNRAEVNIKALESHSNLPFWVMCFCIVSTVVTYLFIR